MSHQTHYRSYRGRVFTGQMTQTTVSKQWSRPSLNLVKISPVQSVKCNTPMLKVKGSVSRSHSKCQLITDISVPYRKLESLNLMTTSEFWSEAGKWQCVCVCVCAHAAQIEPKTSHNDLHSLSGHQAAMHRSCHLSWLLGHQTLVGKVLSFTNELSLLLSLFFIRPPCSAATQLIAIKCIPEVQS